MLCLAEGFCIPWLVIIAAVVALAVGAGYIVLQANRNADAIGMQVSPSGRTDEEMAADEEEEMDEEEDLPTVKVDQRILFDTCKGFECNLVVLDVDEEDQKITGSFLVDGLPADATDVDVHYNRNDEEIVVTFDTPGGSTELYFEVENPDNSDDLDGYNWFAEYADAKVGK